MNKALLDKWLWKFVIEKEALWRKVVWWKYGNEEGKWWSKESRNSFGVGLWKFIRNVLTSFQGEIIFKVGDGGFVRFWKDVWWGETSWRDV